jgi:hypothetical protein
VSSRSPAKGETRSAPLGLRITPRLKAELEELAKADRRTLASYIELVLEAHVEAKKQDAVKKRR